MWWRGGSRSVKHRKVIGDLKTIRGSRSIWQREVNVDLQTRGGSRSVRHEEVNGFDIVKPRLNMSINPFTIGTCCFGTFLCELYFDWCKGKVNTDIKTQKFHVSFYYRKCKGYHKICTCTGSLNSSLDILTDYVISVAFEL